MAKTTLSLFALSATLLATASPAHSQQNSSSPPLVNVTGEAEIRVAPDVVVITFGVEARATGLDEAVAAHSEKVSKLIGHIKAAGVEGKHIQTDYINIRPSYDHRVSKTKPSHFEVNKSVTVRVTDIKKFETLLAGALKTGPRTSTASSSSPRSCANTATPPGPTPSRQPKRRRPP